MSTKIKDVMRALRPEKVQQYFQNFIYRQQRDLRYHPQGAQRFVFKLMFGAQFIFYFAMYFGWNQYLISEKRAVIKKALDDAHIH